MSDIPTELHREILKRVPVEDLFKLRSVCRTWLSIIDGPAFVKKHFHRGIGEDWLFVERFNGGKIYKFPLKNMISNEVPCVKWVLATNVKNLVGRGVPRLRNIHAPSCNGLILISSRNKNMFWRIWNPFTRESLKLVQCDELENVDWENVTYYHCGIGFGYDEATDDYKVVRIVEFRTYIYSVNSRMWRRIEDIPFHGSPISNKIGAFAYGALHWLSYPREENEFLGSIAALNLNTEKYHKVPLPPEFDLYNPTLVALNDCLFLNSPLCLNEYFVMWSFKGYGSSELWVKSVTMESKSNWSPIAYLKSKEWILLCRNFDQVFCWYDIRKNCTEQIFMKIIPQFDNLDNYHITREPISFEIFPASLVRLMGSDGVDESLVSEGTSKRKTKRTVANERLQVKIVFGDDIGLNIHDVESCSSDLETCSEEESYSDEDRSSDKDWCIE